jgi:CrcB protein
MNFSPLAIVLVGLGGATGSVLRYVISTLVQSQSTSGFPYGTLAVNMVGSFIIGLLIGLSIQTPTKMSENLRLLISTGFCGGFTTFSAFSAESIAFIDKGEFSLAAAYILLSIMLGLGATFVGILLTKQI